MPGEGKPAGAAVYPAVAMPGPSLNGAEAGPSRLSTIKCSHSVLYLACVRYADPIHIDHICLEILLRPDGLRSYDFSTP